MVLDYLQKVFTTIIFLSKIKAHKDVIKDILFPPKHHPWFPGLLSATGNANIIGLGNFESVKNTKQKTNL